MVSKNAYAFSDYFEPAAGGTLYDTTFVRVPAETYLVGGDAVAPADDAAQVTSSEALADTLAFWTTACC